jgi:hypothetical protein
MRASGGKKAFVSGQWIDAGPSNCDLVRKGFELRSAKFE